MFNLLRMDLYRIKRSPSVYICLAILLSLSALCCWLVWLMETPDGRQTAMKMGMFELEELAELEAEGNALADMDLLEMFRDVGMDGGFYCSILGIVVALFVCMDFQSGYIKNIMAAHRNRWTYVVSKVLTAGFVNFLYLLISFGFCLLMNFLFHLVPFTSWNNILFYLAWAWLISTAFTSLIIAICIFTRSAALGILGTILFGSGIIVTFLSYLTNLFHLGQWADYTLYFNMTYGPSVCTGIGDLKIFAIGLVFMALYTAAASSALTRQDI